MDINKLKDIQNDVIRKSKIINIVCICIWIIVMFVIFKLKLLFLYYVIVSVTILAFWTIIRCILLNKQIKEFDDGFKKIFVSESLNKIFSNLNYDPNKGLDYYELANTKMMNMGDRYSSNDYFEAEYKNVKIRQADVDIQEKHETTDSDGNTTTTWITIFAGKWMIFDFNKTFNANIQVSQKGFGNSYVSNWGEKNKYKKIEMEDSEFNKMFRVYAQYEHDAFYVLTPALMEKIKKITNQIDGKLLFCFINNELHVGIFNYKDSFEYNIFEKINEEKINEEISHDIKIITDFVDQLNLDNSLFRKEV